MAELKLTPEVRKQIKDFIESEAGVFYTAKLDKLIKNKHYKAEQSPESSRDYTQIARGIREAKNELLLDAQEVIKKKV